MSSSAWSRRTAATETEALARGPRGRCRASAIKYKGHVARGNGSRRSDRAPTRTWPSSMNSPTPMSPAAATPSAISTSKSCSATGIDVYTTLNIQHIESLNDVVAQITGVRVRETVPDSILDRADAIELVDITPDDLIQRLKEGKVYVPKQAERALEHFFSPANLTALRELALAAHGRARRRAAARRDAGAGDLRALAGRRSPARLRQRGPARGGAGALHQAPRRPSARALDRALCRDEAQPAIDRGGA